MDLVRDTDGRIDFLSLYGGGRQGLIEYLGGQIREARIDYGVLPETIACWSEISEDRLRYIEGGMASYFERGELGRIINCLGGQTIDRFIPVPEIDEKMREAILAELGTSPLGGEPREADVRMFIVQNVDEVLSEDDVAA